MIQAQQGDNRNVVYRAGPDDLGLGEPVVSRDGSHIAFHKQQRLPEKPSPWVADAFTEAILAGRTDGTGLRSILELRPRGIAIRGAHLGISLAWSFDNSRIALVAEVQDSASPLPPTHSPSDSLSIVEIGSPGVLQVAPTLPRRVRTAVITSQAWAPDNRRLAFVDRQGHVIVFDTLSRAQTDIGPGMYPDGVHGRPR